MELRWCHVVPKLLKLIDVFKRNFIVRIAII